LPDIQSKDPRFTLRRAVPEDAALVLDFMRKLGAYQKMADAITATEASIRKLLTDRQGEAVFGLYDGAPVGFIFFNQTSSAFTGRAGLFIDGFLIDDTRRHRGLGKLMMAFLATEALDRGCQMLEWGCLDWNAPAIAFYQGLGAYCLDEIRIYRLAPDGLQTLAAQF
jgi:GNAT superfamily N-acetyltransferase